MADKEFEADDPYELVGVRFPLAPGVDGDALTARTFVEEYALLGTPREKVFQLFTSPFFAGTHAILQARGADFVRGIVDEVFGPPAQEA